MKTTLLILLGLVALLALIMLVLFIAGSQMPREHRSVVSVTLPGARAEVWAAITDYAKMPRWWPAVKSIRLEKLSDGTELTWNTDRHHHEIPFRTVESKTNERLVRAIASEKLPFGGTWTYELADGQGDTTRLTLTEDGVIHPPIFRAVAKWFIGLDTTQRDYLAHLEKHLARAAVK